MHARCNRGAKRLMASGRAGVPPALPGVPPSKSNNLRRRFPFDVGPTRDDPGGTPGPAGGTPALPEAICAPAAERQLRIVIIIIRSGKKKTIEFMVAEKKGAAMFPTHFCPP
jgi:hypothetical protein